VVWLAAVLVVHDAVLAPLGALAGRLLGRTARRGARLASAVPVVGAGVAVAVVLVLLAVPALLSPGVPGNATALPRDYGRGLALLLALDMVLVAVTATGRALLAGRRRAGAGLDG